jgi:hypothetical protein
VGTFSSRRTFFDAPFFTKVARDWSIEEMFSLSKCKSHAQNLGLNDYAVARNGQEMGILM